MAANSKTWDEILLNEFRYIDSLHPSKELRKELISAENKVKYIKSKSFNNSSPLDSIPFGFPACYWKSILSYNQSEAIKKITIPIFILQGERDYLITMGDYHNWQKVLKANKNVSFKSYHKLNHYFMEWFSNKKSLPQEYYFVSHIPDYVMRDISTWAVKNFK